MKKYSLVLDSQSKSVAVVRNDDGKTFTSFAFDAANRYFREFHSWNLTAGAEAINLNGIEIKNIQLVQRGMK